MADAIKRYAPSNIDGSMEESNAGSWVHEDDYKTAIKEAVTAERKAWADAVAQGLPPDIAKAIDEILARGAGYKHEIYIPDPARTDDIDAAIDAARKDGNG